MKKRMALLAALLLSLLLHACVMPLTPDESVMAVYRQANNAQEEQPVPEMKNSRPQREEAVQLLEETNEPQCIGSHEQLEQGDSWFVAHGTMDVFTASDGMFHLYVPGEYKLASDYPIGQTYLVNDNEECVLALTNAICGYSLTGQVKVVFLNAEGELRYILYE